jgi:hypothetical protein
MKMIIKMAVGWRETEKENIELKKENMKLKQEINKIAVRNKPKGRGRSGPMHEMLDLSDSSMVQENQFLMRVNDERGINEAFFRDANRHSRNCWENC